MQNALMSVFLLSGLWYYRGFVPQNTTTGCPHTVFAGEYLQAHHRTITGSNNSNSVMHWHLFHRQLHTETIDMWKINQSFPKFHILAKKSFKRNVMLLLYEPYGNGILKTHESLYFLWELLVLVLFVVCILPVGFLAWRWPALTVDIASTSPCRLQGSLLLPSQPHWDWLRLLCLSV